MKRLITIVVMLAILCTCIAGCGKAEVKDVESESASNTNGTNGTFANGEDEEGTLVPGSLVAPEEGISDIDDVGSILGVDNYNPVLGADGMYTYNIRGYEIKLSINIWDYIGNPKYDNQLRLKAIADYYGFTGEVNGDAMYSNPTTDTAAGFEIADNFTKIHFVYGHNENIHRVTLRYLSYMTERMELFYNIQERYLSLEFAIILAYIMEQTNADPEANPLEFLLEYRDSDPDLYTFDYPLPLDN